MNYLISDSSYNQVPQELKNLPRWVGFTPDKIPMQAHGVRASSTNPTTWSTFERACEFASTDGLAGVGFVFNGDGIVGIDLDACVNDGEPMPWALEVISQFDSYTEFSPSGNGIHIYCRGSKPVCSSKKEHVECYATTRYFTVTGNQYGKCNEIKECQAAINWLCRAYLNWDQEQVKKDKKQEKVGIQFDDQETARICLKLLAPWRADDYGEWIRVGMVLYSLNLYDAWVEFSKMSSKFDESECRKKWPSLVPKLANISWLIAMARDDAGADRFAEAIKHLHTGISMDKSFNMQRREKLHSGKKYALDKFKPFPVDALPEPIQSFVESAAHAIGCDASYIALPMLSGLASAIGNTHRIALKNSWSEPAIIWTAIVGESGTAKSPALELPLRAIRKRQRLAMTKHAEALKDFEVEFAEYEKLLKESQKASSTIPAPFKPEPPTCDRCWTDDATTEALAVRLKENPRGLLMVRDELSGWFNFDRYAQGKGGDVAKWLEMFGGRSMVVDRKGSGTIYVPHASVSIAGGIQPETLRRALGQEHRDNGLAARLLFAMPPRNPKAWSEADMDPKCELAVAEIFDELFSLSMDIDADDNQQPKLIKLSKEGKTVWIKFYNEHAQEQVNLSGDEAAAWSKLEGYVPRFALVIHLVRRFANDPALRDHYQVDELSVGAGIRIARWFGEESKRVYGILSESDGDRDRRRLIEWIQGKGGTATARELSRGPREYRGDNEHAKKALDGLVDAGMGCWSIDDHEGGQGRRSDRFTLIIPSGDTGDGDTNTLSPHVATISVAVAAVASTPEDEIWGSSNG